MEEREWDFGSTSTETTRSEDSMTSDKAHGRADSNHKMRLSASTTMRESSSVRLAFINSTLCLLAILLLSLPECYAAASCLRFADYDSINALFTSGGPGTIIQLCPSKIYRLSGPIIFTAADQELTTFGRPKDDTRAILRIQGNGETAIQGDCRRCKGVKIKNLIIDGNRPKLGRSKPTEMAGALVVLGGNEGQIVQDCILKDPRGYTALHIREGDKLECKKASVIGNEIGPIGEEYDPLKDGEDPELSPFGRPLADGVTLACRDSIISDNIFRDNTAAAIVLYCSPGTIVENNKIIADKYSAMAGILMVDATPFKADYSGVIVRQNTISASGSIIRVGIGIGPTVWSDDTETVLRDGSVLGNKLEGDYMGYGIAAAGLKGWTILDNINNAKYEGKRGDRCFPETVNPDPMPFLFTKATIKQSKMQKDFVDADFQYAACLDPVEPQKGKGKKPNRDAVKKQPIPADKPQSPPKVEPKAVGANPATKHSAVEDVEDDSGMAKFDTGSDVMDGILEHSRARMIEEIGKLSHRVDGLSSSSNNQKAEKVPPTKLGSIAGLQMRVEALERDQGKLVEEATGLRNGMQKWNEEMTKVHAWEHELLLDIQTRLHDHFSIHPSDHIEIKPGGHHDDHSGHEANQAILDVPHNQAGKESSIRGDLRQKSERARLLAKISNDQDWTSWVVLGALAGMGVMGWKLWRGGKKGKNGLLKTGGSGVVSTGGGGPGVGVGPHQGQQVRGTGDWWNLKTWFWRGNHRKEI